MGRIVVKFDQSYQSSEFENWGQEMMTVDDKNNYIYHPKILKASTFGGSEMRLQFIL